MRGRLAVLARGLSAAAPAELALDVAQVMAEGIPCLIAETSPADG